MLALALTATAYLIQGFALAYADVRADPMHRPMWAFDPSSRAFITWALIWPMRDVARANQRRWPAPIDARDIIDGLQASALQLVPTVLLLWGFYELAALAELGAVFEFVAAVVTLRIVDWLLGRILGPVFALVILPLGFLLAWLVSLVAPDHKPLPPGGTARQ